MRINSLDVHRVKNTKVFETPTLYALNLIPDTSQNNIEHINNQEAHRQSYYKNYVLSIMRPIEVLTIIHDKMEHAKTICPCYARKIKATDGFFKLPVIVTCLYEITNMC
jgi:ferredoxin-thioredoxin reductase catalytic subunit